MNGMSSMDDSTSKNSVVHDSIPVVDPVSLWSSYWWEFWLKFSNWNMKISWKPYCTAKEHPVPVLMLIAMPTLKTTNNSRVRTIVAHRSVILIYNLWPSAWGCYRSLKNFRAPYRSLKAINLCCRQTWIFCPLCHCYECCTCVKCISQLDIWS